MKAPRSTVARVDPPPSGYFFLGRPCEKLSIEVNKMLEIKDVNQYYGGSHILRDVSLQAEIGEVTVILGRNGVGKTTLLKSLMGLVPIKSGSIELDGEPIQKLTPYERARLGLGFVPQGREIFARLTVEENLRMGGCTRSDKRGVADDMELAYQRFPRLRERRRQQAGTLSGGEQQMLAISRALMLRPKLLLLDEPSFGLAPLIVAEIFEILRQINVQDKVSILLVEQNAAMALDIADRAYLLESGRVVLSGSATEIQQNDAVRRSYLGF